MKVIIFDVASSFGFFRRGFTTTSALTFAVIPRSAVEGLIGAILGYSRINFPDLLKESKIAVELMSSVRKMNMKYMHINPKWWNETLSNYIKGVSCILLKQREQMAVPASIEYLLNPAYRIYIDTNNEKINNELSQSLGNKQSHYTPFLGSSSMIASTKFLGEFEYKRYSSKTYVQVSSIIPFHNSEKMPNIKLEKGLKFAIEEDLSIHVNNHRAQEGTYKVVYTIEPRKMMLIDKDIIEVEAGEENKYVKFLPLQTQITS